MVFMNSLRSLHFIYQSFENVFGISFKFDNHKSKINIRKTFKNYEINKLHTIFPELIVLQMLLNRPHQNYPMSSAIS